MASLRAWRGPGHRTVRNPHRYVPGTALGSRCRCASSSTQDRTENVSLARDRPGLSRRLGVRPPFVPVPVRSSPPAPSPLVPVPVRSSPPSSVRLSSVRPAWWRSDRRRQVHAARLTGVVRHGLRRRRRGVRLLHQGGARRRSPSGRGRRPPAPATSTGATRCGWPRVPRRRASRSSTPRPSPSWRRRHRSPRRSCRVWSRWQNASGPRLLPLHAAVASTTPARQEATTGPRMPASQAVRTPRRSRMVGQLSRTLPLSSCPRRRGRGASRPPLSNPSSRRCVVLATIRSATLLGARGRPVIVEVHVGQGLPGVQRRRAARRGVPRGADRVRAALAVERARLAQSNALTVNLAPSGVRKGGAGLDLADRRRPPGRHGGGAGRRPSTGLGVRGRARARRLDPPGHRHRAARRRPRRRRRRGARRLRARGRARRRRGRSAGVASLDRRWSRVPRGARSRGPIHHPIRARRRRTRPARPHRRPGSARRPPRARGGGGRRAPPAPDRAARVGQDDAGAAAARRCCPLLEPDVALETTMIHSAAGVCLPAGGPRRRPPLPGPAPHGVARWPWSAAARRRMRPGEVSCAHGGVALLRRAGRVRAPPCSTDSASRLEEGVVRVTRARATVDVPGPLPPRRRHEPVPVRRKWHQPGACRCGRTPRLRYLRRVSGPLLDRFDLRARGRPTRASTSCSARPSGEPSAVVPGPGAPGAATARWREASPSTPGIPAHRLDELAPLTAAATRRAAARARGATA